MLHLTQKLKDMDEILNEFGKAAEADWFIGRIIYRDELHS